jgi:hypothetical protein
VHRAGIADIFPPPGGSVGENKGEAALRRFWWNGPSAHIRTDAYAPYANRDSPARGKLVIAGNCGLRMQTAFANAWSRDS